MKNETQLNRYKKLVDFIDKHFKEEIDIPKVEAVCHYSYRNINRIFLALHHETIGKYVKRIRLEKAAEYLKYSKQSVSDIAFEVGFSDVAAFSKAFKNKFNCSPSAFRATNDLIQDVTRQTLQLHEGEERKKIEFKIEELPEVEVLFLEYKGDYNNIKAIDDTWKQLVEYTLKKDLLTEKSIFFAEILDDNEISECIHCRYNVAIILEKPLNFTPEGFFRSKKIKRQKYAKFLHKGTHESSADTYNKIYAHWMTDVKLELADLPTLEFYLNDEEGTPPEELLTEIYIPLI